MPPGPDDPELTIMVLSTRYYDFNKQYYSGSIPLTLIPIFSVLVLINIKIVQWARLKMSIILDPLVNSNMNVISYRMYQCIILQAPF
jgi:hypothetical protein